MGTRMVFIDDRGDELTLLSAGSAKPSLRETARILSGSIVGFADVYYDDSANWRKRENDALFFATCAERSVGNLGRLMTRAPRDRPTRFSEAVPVNEPLVFGRHETGVEAGGGAGAGFSEVYFRGVRRDGTGFAEGAGNGAGRGDGVADVS